MTVTCKRGHPLTKDSTYKTNWGGFGCRECRKESRERRKEKIKRQAKERYDQKMADGSMQERRRQLRLQLKIEVMTRYCNGEPRCACCGQTRIHHLVFDHIEGGGKQHIAQIGHDLAPWLKKNGYPAGFQVLCAGCNTEKGILGRCGCQDGLD